MPEADSIAALIVSVREHKVLLDSDLATLYGVETKALNRAVRRNLDRFPEDFMFQLTREEADALRFQSGTSNQGRGGRRYLPYVFTQEGVAMLSSVLHSPRAVAVNIGIMRAFIRLRQMALSAEELVRKVGALERRYDDQFKIVFDAIRQLLTPPDPPRKRIGFHADDKD
jgi:hypothetical protein